MDTPTCDVNTYSYLTSPSPTPSPPKKKSSYATRRRYFRAPLLPRYQVVGKLWSRRGSGSNPLSRASLYLPPVWKLCCRYSSREIVICCDLEPFTPGAHPFIPSGRPRIPSVFLCARHELFFGIYFPLLSIPIRTTRRNWRNFGESTPRCKKVLERGSRFLLAPRCFFIGAYRKFACFCDQFCLFI